MHTTPSFSAPYTRATKVLLIFPTLRCVRTGRRIACTTGGGSLTPAGIRQEGVSDLRATGRRSTRSKGRGRGTSKSYVGAPVLVVCRFRFSWDESVGTCRPRDPSGHHHAPPPLRRLIIISLAHACWSLHLPDDDATWGGEGPDHAYGQHHQKNSHRSRLALF
jgi:hypothetical protein